jgi:hemerythrin-like domain-containing protein
MKTPASHSPKITDRLREQHRVILGELDRLERWGGACQTGARPMPAELDRFKRFFTDFVECTHEGIEEALLFPALERRHLTRQAGSLHGLEAAHVRHHALLARMNPWDPDATCRAILEYVAHLREHIDFEERVLFPLADQTLTEADQAELVREFDAVLAGTAPREVPPAGSSGGRAKNPTGDWDRTKTGPGDYFDLPRDA